MSRANSSLLAKARTGRLRILLVIFLAFLPGGRVLSQQKRVSPHFRITGTLVNRRDGASIPRGQMTATLVGEGRGSGQTSVLDETSENGHFALEVPSAGRWRLTASAHGFRSQSLDEHDGGFFTAVVLTPAAPVCDLVFRATSDGVIRGVITDEAGDPVRNAQVRLYSLHPEALQSGQRPLQPHGGSQTDDRGHYEFAGLSPGAYQLSVEAHPWYASQRPSSQTGGAVVPDPSLDVVYPLTWYPGVEDDASADVLTMHPGEVRQADLRLSPVASAHLLLPVVLATGPGDPAPGLERGQPGLRRPQVSRLMPDGSTQPVMTTTTASGSNMLDIGGLVPGTYQIGQPGAAESEKPTIVHVSAGGSVTEVSGASNEITVTIAVDGGTNVEASGIRLLDAATGRIFGYGAPFDFRGGFASPEGQRGNQGGGRQGPGQGPGRRGSDARNGNRRRGTGDTREASLVAPPGEYQVLLPVNANVFLTGISAKGAQVKGRTVNLQEGTPRLLVHLASGLAKIEGTARLGSAPSVGAMILLVPATLGDASSLTIVRRDQTNTDGSFGLEDVIPGQYILLAIDHGWDVNWNDAATLRPYLLHGVPLDLAASSTTHPVLAPVEP